MKDKLIGKLALGGVLAATIILLTALVSIPLPGGHGYINLGDAGVLLAAALLGGPWGALCGCAASALSDILLGWSIYVPATLCIKAGEAFIAAALIKALYGTRLKHAVLFPAALLVPIGYGIYEWMLYGAATAAVNALPNLLQCLVGAAIAQALLLALQRADLPALQGALPTQSAGEIVREPKGGPDVIYCGNEADVVRMLRAGNLLSVRGYTARIVRLNGTLQKGGLNALQKQALLSDTIPVIDAAANKYLSPEALAEMGVKELRE